MNHEIDEAMEDLSNFQLRSRREIISLLRHVATQNQLVQMQANGGADSGITSILEVDDAANMVIVDCASSALLTERLLESQNIAFDTALDSIRILFQAPALERCEHEGRPALRFALPEAVVRLQRREYYRVKTPVMNPVRCTIKTQPNENEAPLTVIAPLRDVSGGGIAIIDEKKQLDAAPGQIYKDCRIDLPGSPVTMTLQIRSVRNVKLATGKQVHHIGCEFVNPSPGALAAIQRYITKLEREQNARATGMN